MLKKITKKEKTKKTFKPGKWLDDIFSSMGKFIHIETTEGLMREGRVTNFRVKHIKVNGIVRDYPIALEINNDEGDYIYFDLISEITID